RCSTERKHRDEENCTESAQNFAVFHIIYLLIASNIVLLILILLYSLILILSSSPKRKGRPRDLYRTTCPLSTRPTREEVQPVVCRHTLLKQDCDLVRA